MTSRRALFGDRPPSFMKKATLAAELDISESTVDVLVQRGFLPKPIRLGGSLLWNWSQVNAALVTTALSLEADPFMQGITNVS
ncbi:MAG TPA: transcriptional regulator [Paracoccus sp.]|nr:transcriptional regulator [Paracoccus sp. (in: a-proteobacteria)]